MEPNFEFGKKIGIVECCYGNVNVIGDMIKRMLACMQETNKIYGRDCEYFRLDFRPPTLDETWEFPNGSLILDLKFGCKKIDNNCGE